MSYRILTIDDSMAIRGFISKTLSQDDPSLEILVAKDGAQGIESAQTSIPNLILLDFILPDMKGDAVCEALANDPTTAAIPIILMSSNASDIKRTETLCGNVVRTIVKPFTPELLTAAVHYVIREGKANRGETKPVPLASAGGVLFSGYSSAFPVHRAFLVLEEEGLTGILKIQRDEVSILCYVRAGQLKGVSTLQPEEFHHASFAMEPAAMERAKAAQAETGCPIFSTLAGMGFLSKDLAAELWRDEGNRLLATIWTHGRFHYQFEALAELPDFVPKQSSLATMDELLLDSIRLIQAENQQSALAWGDLSGIPIYTRDGYERIQEITINEEEAAFLAEIGDATLRDIARRLDWSDERAQAMLFRFLCLRIFEYWPSALLHGNPEENATPAFLPSTEGYDDTHARAEVFVTH